jgi:hypothetical protein
VTLLLTVPDSCVSPHVFARFLDVGRI